MQSSGESNGSAKKASATKASRLEAEVNELNFQLRSAQKQKEDLQLEFEKLQVTQLPYKSEELVFIPICFLIADAVPDEKQAVGGSDQ